MTEISPLTLLRPDRFDRHARQVGFKAVRISGLLTNILTGEKPPEAEA